MIETLLYDYLSNSEELGATVYMEIPKDIEIPSNYYLVEKTGGSMNNHISTSTVAIQSYAESLLDAVEMNEAIKNVMLYGLIDDTDIVSVSLNSDYNFTDTETKQYRYQAVFDIVHY